MFSLLFLTSVVLAAPTNPKVVSLAVHKNTTAISIGQGHIEPYFFTNVSLGTPPEQFTVLVDTGSSDLWVPSNGAEGQDCEGDQCAPFPGGFNPALSTTNNILNADFSVGYVGSSSSGVWVTDTLQVGPITLDNFQFGVANTIVNSSTGVFGLSFKEQEGNGANGYNNFPYALKQQGYIDKAAYSLYFNSAGATEGTLLFGGYDKAKYAGELQWQQVPDGHDGASVVVDTITLGGVDIPLNTGFTLDSGSIFTYLPDDAWSSVAKQVKVGQYNETLGAFYIDCNAKVEVQVNFPTGKISMSTESLIYQLSSIAGMPENAGCYFGLQDTRQSDGYALLGDSFLRNAYVVYDIEDYQVGYAQAVYTEKSDVVAFPSGPAPTGF